MFLYLSFIGLGTVFNIFFYFPEDLLVSCYCFHKCIICKETDPCVLCFVNNQYSLFITFLVVNQQETLFDLQHSSGKLSRHFQPYLSLGFSLHQIDINWFFIKSQKVECFMYDWMNLIISILCFSLVYIADASPKIIKQLFSTKINPILNLYNAHTHTHTHKQTLIHWCHKSPVCLLCW